MRCRKRRDLHVRTVRKRNCKRLANENVGQGFLSLADTEIDAVRAADLSPGDIHRIDFPIFIISSNHQYRHWEYSLLDTKILFHFIKILLEKQAAGIAALADTVTDPQSGRGSHPETLKAYSTAFCMLYLNDTILFIKSGYKDLQSEQWCRTGRSCAEWRA